MKIFVNWDSPSLWKTLAGGAGIVGAAIGLIVLTGWLLDVAAMKSIHPNWVAMKANTATGFFLSGAALWLKSRDDTLVTPLQRFSGQFFAALVALLGLLTLIEFTFAHDLGIDQLLFHEAPGAIKTLAPASALCFLSLGLALLSRRNTARSSRTASILAVITVFPALASGLTYLYGIENGMPPPLKKGESLRGGRGGFQR